MIEMRGFTEILKLMDQKSLFFDVFSYDAWNENIEKEFFNLLECKIEDVIFAILVRENDSICPSNVPMFSNFDDCTTNMCLLLDCINNRGVTMIELGKLFREYDAKDTAYYKYGESHAKTASLLGLTVIRNCDSHLKVYLTNAGYFLCKYPQYTRLLLERLILRTAIIQKIIKNYYMSNLCVCDCLECLSYTTKVRRMPNVKKILEYLSNSEEFDFLSIYTELNYICKEN